MFKTNVLFIRRENKMIDDLKEENSALAPAVPINGQIEENDPFTDLKAQAQEYGQRISGAATKAKDYLSERAGVAGEKLKELQKKDLNEVVDEAKDIASKNPGKTIAISPGVGLLIGLLIRAGRK
jgi:ElaB/YqjD/DUF883 family membrane-anchored ribosome-binding protein